MMNDEKDQLERRLSRQPLREVPPEWREEILAVAGRESRIGGRAPKQLWLSSVVCRLSSVFWPHPAAWAGLAAVWIFICAVDFSARDRMPAVSQRDATPPAEMLMEVHQQQRLLAELLGPRETQDADRQKMFIPKPRSEHTGVLLA